MHYLTLIQVILWQISCLVHSWCPSNLMFYHKKDIPSKLLEKHNISFKITVSYSKRTNRKFYSLILDKQGLEIILKLFKHKNSSNNHITSLTFRNFPSNIHICKSIFHLSINDGISHLMQTIRNHNHNNKSKTPKTARSTTNNTNTNTNTNIANTDSDR